MSILVVLEGEGDALLPSSLSAVTAGVKMGGGADVVGCILGSGDSAMGLAEAASRVEGVGRVLCLCSEGLAGGFAEVEAPVLARVVRDRGMVGVVVSATTYGKNLLPRLGALLDVQPLSDITGVEAGGIYERPIYAGNAVLRVKSRDEVVLVSVRATAFEDASLGEACEIEKLDVDLGDWGGRIRFEGLDRAEHDRPELTTAKVVISGGRGMKSGENFVLLERVALKLKAAVGASRAAVDAGFVSNDLQVGQTGKVVAPDVYIAVGISGAIQHLAGMKDSKVIVAINNDEEAPIFQVADYGLVGDLFTVLPELDAELG